MPKILFIDDDISLLKSYIQIMEREGFEIKKISSATEALKELRDHKDKYDSIICDIQMPVETFPRKETEFGRRTGLLLLEKIREISTEIPIIVLTVVRDPEAKKKAFELGINKYFIKPELPSTIITEIKNILKLK